jgi:hypothetical protein
MGKGGPPDLQLTRGGSVYSRDSQVLVPCYFEGRVVVPADLTEPVEFAVAINGIVCATTRTYRLQGYLDRFSAMVPESAFHEGTNDVRIYMVTGSAPNLRLTECVVHQTRPRKIKPSSRG